MTFARSTSWLTPALAAALVACSPAPVPFDARDPVSIVSFTANPARIESGETSFLAWATKDALAVRLVDDTGLVLGTDDLGVVEGTLEVSPNRTTRYTLAAMGASGAERLTEVVIQVEVTAPDATFEAEDGRIAFGGSTRLAWSASRAKQVRILEGEEILLDGAEPDGSLEVTPARTTLYVLEATGVGGIKKLEATVEVAPMIESFRASPPGPQLLGTTVTLLWKTSGADTLVLKGPKEAPVIPPERFESGAVQVEAGVGAVVLVATRDGVEATSELNVPLLGAPVIGSFAVTPGQVTAGPGAAAPVRVAWKTSGATRLVLERDDDGETTTLEAEGSFQSQVTGTTKFVLRATNGAGETTREAVVHATAPATIDSFRASETYVGAGDPFELTWSTSDAVLVDLLRDGVPVTDEPVPSSGHLSLRTDSSATYRLVAFNAAGTEAAREIAIEVGAPIVDSFGPAFDPAAPSERIPFSWTLRGATSVHVTGPGNTACTGPASEAFPSGSCAGVAPDTEGNHAFTLRAVNGSGATVATQEVRVTTGPIIRRFRASATHASAGDPIELSWLVLDDASGQAATVTLEGDDGSVWEDLDTEGSLPLVLPAGTHSFTLLATTPGSALETRTVTVAILERPTVTLTADPDTFDPSLTRKVTLRWTSSNAVSVELHVVDGQGRLVSPPLRSVTNPALVASGDHDTSDFDGEVTFRVVARNAAGTTAEAEVVVPAVLPAIDAFEASAETVSAGDTVILSWATADGVVSISPAVEVTTTSALVDLSSDGTALALAPCGTTRPLDEGCADLTFPAGFEFPAVDGPTTAARIFANGFLGFGPSAQPGSTAMPSLLPSSAHAFVQLAPFWSDLAFGAGGDKGLWWEDRTEAGRRGLFLLWRGAHDPTLLDLYWMDSSFDVQLVLWESGDVDFRYGAMVAGVDPRYQLDHQERADGKGVTIGWQNEAGTQGGTLNGGAAVPGGLSHRAWRLVRGAPSIGSIEATIHETTTFELCAARSFRKVCRSLTVTVE